MFICWRGNNFVISLINDNSSRLLDIEIGYWWYDTWSKINPASEFVRLANHFLSRLIFKPIFSSYVFITLYYTVGKLIKCWFYVQWARQTLFDFYPMKYLQAFVLTKYLLFNLHGFYFMSNTFINNAGTKCPQKLSGS